ncbi:hypothetical protein LXA43DRAFT_972225 [Ganoderma leucocontextum]|nr:hypothetical protein LXA43DRAFT_972225 [Ganoderma leucocontextum]
MVISDCCCHVSNAIHDVFPDAVVCLDVWHLLMRYLICLVGGSKSPVRADVARDIIDAVLKCRALENTPATYWTKGEQETRLVAAFKKWDERGVWTAAGVKAHEEQLGHVRKGCLTRPHHDVRADGSRIEGMHKGWNSLQRSFSSGIEMMAALGHDFVLRHNTRIESALKVPPKFTHSAFGSHHIHLVADCARRWNQLLERKGMVTAGLQPLPILNVPSSGETFGMMKMSPETAAHQSLASIKKEPVEEEQGLLDLSSQDLLDASRILSQLGIDPSLLYQLPRASAGFSTPHPCTATHNSVGAQPIFAPPPASPTAPFPLPDWPPAEILDVNALYDPDSREQKAEIMEVSGPGSDIGPNTRNSDKATATRKRRAHESGNTTGQADAPIEIPSEDESAAPSQSKPLPRKKLRLHVPGTPAAAKSKDPLNAPSGSMCATSASQATALFAPASQTTTLRSFFPSSQASGIIQPVAIPNTVYFPRPAISGLTPSQHMFSVASGGIDPRSLSLANIDYDEFSLFLRLRAEGQWATYMMSPYHWVCAASVYNKELEKLNQSTQKMRPLKTPRALMDKLFQLEPKLIARIISGQYASRSGNSPAFWYPHCHAFPLQVGGKSGGQLVAKLVNGKKAMTKVHKCHRCERVMYPGPQNSPLNHSHAVCSDGVWQSARVEKSKQGGKVVPSLEEPPSFPQPENLFTSDKEGHSLHVDQLLKLLQAFYQRIMAGVAGSGASALYDIAFAKLLQARVKILDATPTSPMVAIFKPYCNVRSVGVGEGQTYSYCGEEWIHLDYLSPKAELTEDKMRALVELYHQSASFITKANLSAKIDDAFIRRRKDRTNVQPVEWSMARLEEDLHNRRNRPKFGQMLQPTVHKANDQQVLEFQEWSERRSPRETAVFSALYGVHSRAKPGYDALIDEQRGTEEEDVPKDEQEAEVEQSGGGAKGAELCIE